jgi:hypothetical protein
MGRERRTFGRLVPPCDMGNIHWPNPTPGSGAVVGFGPLSKRDHNYTITSRPAVWLVRLSAFACGLHVRSEPRARWGRFGRRTASN